MNLFLIYLIFAIAIIFVVWGFCKFWDWVKIDPRQAIPDEKFREVKAQERILANGFVDKEEERR